MKKVNLLLVFASSFLLTSCGTETPIEESSASQSEGSSLSVESTPVSESKIEGTPIKGDISRTYLNNAIETSFGKKGYVADIKDFKLESLTREYTVGDALSPSSDEHALIKTNNTVSDFLSSPNVTWTSIGRNTAEHRQLGGHIAIKDANYIEKENNVEIHKEEHQYSNIYLKDNKYYYNFLNDQGVETLGLLDMMNETFEDFISTIGEETTFEMEPKGYIEVEDEDISSVFDALMPRTTFVEFIPTVLDLVIDNLDEVEGATFTYEGEKIGSDKFYTTTIEITDPKAIFEGIHNIIDNLPDAVDDILGEDFSKDDILEIFDEFEEYFDFAKKFDLKVILNYSTSTLRTINYSFEYEGKENHTTTIDPEDEETLESLELMEKLSMSGNTSFTFGDTVNIDYPDFSSYPKIELETEAA